MAWIAQNLESIVATLVLGTALTLIVLRLIRNKKQGKHLCGGGCGGCGGCPNAGACHSSENKKN